MIRKSKLRLTPARLRYLLTFANLEQATDVRGVRCIDVAVRLGVARPSVCRMLSSFEKDGLIIQDGSRLFHTTPEGREAVEGYLLQYRQIFPLFQELLSLSQFDSEECAMTLLSFLDPSVLDHLCKRLLDLSKERPDCP